MYLTVTASNVKSGKNPMSEEKVRFDYALSFKHGGVIGLQEIKPYYYKTLLQEVLKKKFRGFNYVALDTKTPIVYPESCFKVLRIGVRRISGRFPGFQPARYLVMALCEEEGTGERIAFMNTHFVSGAWNDKRLPFKKWRQKAWTKNFETTRELIHHHVEDLQIPVVLTGDLNRTTQGGLERFHKSQETFRSGLMNVLVFLPVGWKIRRRREHETTNNYSDHPILTASFDLFR